MQRDTKLAVVKSPTGLFWWVVNKLQPNKPLAVRDTKWEAESKLEDLQRIVRNAIPA
ncbi:hypothetical protein altidsur_25 [Escherichia phage altidsur]|uniref:Uncharacterized protein n=1 Tax=Escherichia phage altidsur TaxID=2696381 RepID=A0A6B9WKS0_9CAUD|nr:hypothetical protein altidsur_25 [Escherichia phage altidsur]